MKRSISKAAAILLMSSIAANSAPQMPVSASSAPEITSIIFGMNAQDLLLYENAAADLGYSSVESLFQEAALTFSPSDYSSTIRDIDGDHQITVTDAILMMKILAGTYEYNHSFESLDVDGNLVLNSTDALIYLQFASYMQIHPELNVNIPLGTGSAPASVFENRTYVKHDMSNGTSPSANDTVFTLCSDGTVVYETNPWTDPNYSPSASYFEVAGEQADDLRTSLYSRVQDTRVVRNSGTGFIIGEHTIITNAHCVFDQEYSTDDVSAFTFDSNNEPIRHDLTVVSYYVPMAFIDTSYSDISPEITDDDGNIVAYHDYAIIVVEEDLTSYGKFECGIPLEGLAGSSVTSNTASYGFPQDSDGMCRVYDPDLGTYRKYTVASYGGVDGFARGYWIRTTLTEATTNGMSGSPIVLNSVTVNNNTISCDETVIGINRSGPSARGACIVKPILQFVYGNDILDTQTDLL